MHQAVPVKLKYPVLVTGVVLTSYAAVNKHGQGVNLHSHPGVYL